MLKVEPLNAILDPQYFVRAVHGCVLAVLQQRARAAQRAASWCALGVGCFVD